jgi:peroxidase
VPLVDAWRQPASRVQRSGGLDPLLRGALRQRAGAADAIYAEGARNGFLGTALGPALDLAALDIMRGRDLGLASYGSARRAFGLPAVRSFDVLAAGGPDDNQTSPTNLSSTVQRRLAERLRELYGHSAARRGAVDDEADAVGGVDLLVGVLLERPLRGGCIGSTLAAIIAEQLVRTRDGDRFWFENAASVPHLAASFALGARATLASASGLIVSEKVRGAASVEEAADQVAAALRQVRVADLLRLDSGAGDDVGADALHV